MIRKCISFICIIMVIMSTLCALADFPDYVIPAYIYNCKEYVTLRSWPSTKAPALERVYLGEEINLLSRHVNREGDADFVLIETQHNVGYVLLNYIELFRGNDWYLLMQEDTWGIGYGTITAKDPYYHTVLRSGPGIDYKALGYLFGGEVISYLGRSEKDSNDRVWYCCELDDTVCWVSSKYVKLRKP